MTFVNISSSAFSGNEATLGAFGGGGAVYTSGGVLALENNTFTGNAANGYGGALAYSDRCISGEKCLCAHAKMHSLKVLLHLRQSGMEEYTKCS